MLRGFDLRLLIIGIGIGLASYDTASRNSSDRFLAIKDLQVRTLQQQTQVGQRRDLGSTTLSMEDALKVKVGARSIAAKSEKKLNEIFPESLLKNELVNIDHNSNGPLLIDRLE